MGREARRRDRFALWRCADCETRTELGACRATIPGAHRSRKSRPGSLPHGRVRGRDYQRSAAEVISMSETFVEARPLDSDWPGWLQRELAPTRRREIRTAIIAASAVLCVII